MKKRIGLWALKLIGVVLFAIILMNINTREMALSIRRASLASIIITLCIFPALFLVKSLRWHLMTKAIGAESTFRNSAYTYMSGLFLGIVTPGKVGEAIKIPSLTAMGIPMKEAVVVTVWDRLLDVFFLAVIAAIGGVYYYAVDAATSVFVCTGIIVVILVCLLRIPKLKELTLPKMQQRDWGTAIFITAISWCAYYLQLYILAQGFGIVIVLPVFFAMMAMMSIVNALPIAPAGLGTRDAMLLLFFTEAGINPELTVAFSLTIFILTMIASTLGAYCWLRHPLSQ